MILFCIAILLSFIYIFLVFSALRGLFKSEQSQNTEHSYPFCSVIIAAKNEENSIETCLASLCSQNYPTDCYEIILINDHSTDNTLSITQSIANQHNNIQILSAPNEIQGKKQSLRYGLSHAQGSFILFTDADCELHPNWIDGYMSYMLTHNGSLFFGNVIPQISKNSTIVERCAALDFIGILGIQNGLAQCRHAFSCNGANMAITKEFYQHYYNTNENYTSGDDVFLLHTAKKTKKSNVHYIPYEGTAIKTNMPQTLEAFFLQRIRWTSKAGGYKDADSIAVALIVYIYCLALFSSFIAMLCQNNIGILIFTLLFLCKFVSDSILFIQTSKQYQSKSYIRLVLPLECIYFIYTTIIPIVSIFYKGNWKEKKISNQ